MFDDKIVRKNLNNFFIVYVRLVRRPVERYCASITGCPLFWTEERIVIKTCVDAVISLREAENRERERKSEREREREQERYTERERE